MRRRVLVTNFSRAIAVAIGLVLASTATAEDLSVRCDKLLDRLDEATASSNDATGVGRVYQLAMTGEAYCESGYFGQGIIVLMDALDILEPPETRTWVE